MIWDSLEHAIDSLIHLSLNVFLAFISSKKYRYLLRLILGVDECQVARL